MPTNDIGITTPGGGDPPDGPGDMLRIGDRVRDLFLGHTYAEINSFGGDDLWEGRKVWQTNGGTSRPYEGLYTYDGIGWRQPWNLPWGEVPGGYGESSGPSGLVGSKSDAGATCTFDAVANRRYIMTASCRIAKDATAGDVVLHVTSGGGGTFWQRRVTFPANAVKLIHYDFDAVGIAAATITRKLMIEPIAGQCNATEDAVGHNFIRIRDDGPTGPPA